LDSEGARAKKGITCHRFLPHKTEIEEEENLTLHRKRDVDPYQAALINVDFQDFLSSLPPYLQGMVRLALKSYSPFEIADLYHLSRSRISQLRREIQERLSEFWGVRPSWWGRKRMMLA